MKLEGIESAFENEKKQASLFKIPVIQPTAAAAMMYGYSSIQREKSKALAQQNQHDQRITDDGQVASWFLAELLKKDTSKNRSKANKSFKLYPYICLRCKNEIVLCNSPTQTDLNDDGKYVNIVDTKPRSILTEPCNNSSSSALIKSKTIGTKLSDTVDIKKNLAADKTNKANSTGLIQII